MTVESAQYISQLQPNDPAGTDLVSEGDNHLRLIKSVLQNSFEPNIDKPLIPEITDKAKHLLAVNEAADGIEWRDPQDLPTGADFFRYWKSAEQTINPQDGTVRVLFDVEKEDPDNVWNASEWEVGVTGIYHIEAWFRIVEDAIVDHDLAVRVNGSPYKQLSYTDYLSGGNKLHSMQISSAVICTAGDKIDIAARSESKLVIQGATGGTFMSGVSGYRIR